MGAPRDPVRIVMDQGMKKLYQPATGKDWTGEMKGFIDRVLSKLPALDGFILKYRSPSCGPSNVKIYTDKTSNPKAFKGSGFFGSEVLSRFSGLAIEDEGRLKNFSLRENYLIHLFTLASFRILKENFSTSALMNFHARNKYLFMALHEVGLRKMGKIVANHEKKPIEEVIASYEEELKKVLAGGFRVEPIINALQHCFGGVSKDLSGEEKKFFLDLLEEYRDERVPLSVPVRLLESWAIRFHKDFLLEQSLLKPYPPELVEITDSGKGRDFR
jgi:uncharacterized protein YbgA (DUF1722 family)